MKVADTPVTLLPEATMPNTSQPTDIPSKTTVHTSINPPFPHRINKEKPISQEEETFDIIEQLKNMSIQIPLFQAIKDIPLYGKAIKEACLKKPGRKKKDPKIVHVLGKLEDIMLGKVVIPKYLDPSSPVVDLIINGQAVKNALVDLGATINVMTKETMHRLSIEGLRKTPIVLQLANSSTVTSDGLIEDVVVTLDSWEYPADFLILSPKVNFAGYPIILGRPWLATTDAKINFRSGSMTISNGQAIRKLALYPPVQP